MQQEEKYSSLLQYVEQEEIIRDIHAIGRDFQEPEKEIRAKEVVACEKHTPAETLKELLSEKPRIINIGLKSFAEVVEEFGCEVVQYDWAPPAGGNVKLLKKLRRNRREEP